MCIGISALRSLHFSSITLVLSLFFLNGCFVSLEKIIYTRISNQLSLTQDYYISRTNTRVTRELVWVGERRGSFETFEQCFANAHFVIFFREDINKWKIGALPTVRAVQLSKETRDILNIELPTNQSARKFLVKPLMDKIYCCLERIPFPLERNLFGTSARNRSQRPSLWPAPSACEHSRARDYAQTEPFLLRGDRAFQINLRSVTGIGSGFPAAAYPWAHFKS